MAIQTVFLTENTTAYATDVMNLVDPLYTDLDGSNVSDKTGTGTTLVLSASPTFTGSVSLNSGADFKIYSDAGSTLKFFVDGATGNFGVASGAKFYVGGTNFSDQTYIYQSSVGRMDFYTGGVQSLQLTSTGAAFSTQLQMSGNQLFLDNAINTSIRLSSAGVATIKAGGADTFSVSATGVSVAGTLGVSGQATFSSEVLLPNVDPPTANYANRNGIVKGWCEYNQAVPNIRASYNVSSVTDVSTGDFTFNWDTDFSTGDYSVVGTSGARCTSGASSGAGTSSFKTTDTTPSDVLTVTCVIAIGNQ